MKLKDLFEEQKVITGSVLIPTNITTLIGYTQGGIPIAGAKVTGYFTCFNTNITSLEGAPSWVGTDFSCNRTPLRSLEGAPSWVGGEFSCNHTKITSLEGAPSHVGGSLYCYDTKITSLHNIHKQIKHIGSSLVLPDIKSHILGVLFIKGLKSIDLDVNKGVEAIINKHLAGDRDIHAAQEELIDAGLEEYANL